MAGLSVKVQSVGLTFEQAKQDVIDEVKSVEWLVKTAREQHAEVMATPPAPVKWRLFVDGAESNNIENVRWNSQLRFQYARMDVVVEYAIEALTKLSPVLTGRYQATHTLLVDGAPAASLDDWDWGQEIALINFQPYARKIEVGAMKMRVPGTDHVYQNATKFVRAKYGTVASITFTYRALAAGVSLGGAVKPGRVPENMRYPVMLIVGSD